jgi:hypothetical protein
MASNTQKDSNKPVIKLVEELAEDIRSLTSIFIEQDDRLISDFESNALFISQATDEKIQKQIDRVEQKLNEISAVLTNESQVELLNQDRMNKKTEDIMFEYIFIAGHMTLRDYTVGLNQIQTALKKFANAIERYNEIAVSRNWPMVQSLHESQSIAKERVNRSMNELFREMEGDGAKND